MSEAQAKAKARLTLTHADRVLIEVALKHLSTYVSDSGWSDANIRYMNERHPRHAYSPHSPILLLEKIKRGSDA